jgi:DNA polymerase III delta subunit
MHYLFLGKDSLAKDHQIAEFKKKFLTSNEALEFDYEVLHTAKLAPAALKKSLLALPTIASKRLIVLRSMDKLDGHNKQLILDFFTSKASNLILILDFDEDNANNSFIKKLTPYVKIEYFRSDVKKNVFDMTKMMTARNPKESLKILSDLLINGDHPLQILGALVWFWGKQQSRLSRDNFKKGLLMLKEADVNIKRSRLKSEYALEIAVVKLCSLIT